MSFFSFICFVLYWLFYFFYSVNGVWAEPNAETLPAFAKWIQQQKVHSKFNLGAFPESGLGGVARVDIKVKIFLIKILITKSIINHPILFIGKWYFNHGSKEYYNQ